MNDLTVARGYALTKPASAFQYNHVVVGPRKGAGDSKANHTGTDYHGLCFKNFFLHPHSPSLNCPAKEHTPFSALSEK